MGSQKHPSWLSGRQWKRSLMKIKIIAVIEITVIEIKIIKIIVLNKLRWLSMFLYFDDEQYSESLVDGDHF